MSGATLLPSASGGQSRARVVIDHDRHADDWYVEPAWAVQLLLGTVPFIGPIHDPCCGGGTIPKTCGGSGADLVYRGYGEGNRDFFNEWGPFDNLIFNPPYKVAEQFILHALAVTARKVAAIVNIKFLASQGRRERLFIRHPPMAVLVLSRRPSMPPGGTDIPAKGGTADYCWICWDNDPVDRRAPQIRWLA